MSSDPTGLSRADLARAVADAAMSTPGVARLDGGAVGEFATYADGQRVEGVRIGTEEPTEVRLRLAVTYGQPIPKVAADVDAAIRERVATQWRPTRIDIDVVDVVTSVPDDADVAERDAASDRSDSKG